MTRTEILSLAFCYHHVQALVMADERLFRQEVRALVAWNRALIAAGLMTEDGTLAPEYTEARDASLTELATLLSEPERRALIDQLRPIVTVDGEEDPRELRALAVAEAQLGLGACRA